MCGIIGSFNIVPDQCRILNSLRSMYSRGPDASDYIVGDTFFLGHTRLAIIDLSDGGHQPMVSNCGRYTIVFNGEIYNYAELRADISLSYQFKSNSDTEVILAYFAKYGDECLKYFRGMFAFAIHDACEHCLFVCRDRLGVKPLYYTSVNDRFYFASRPTPLLTLIDGYDKKLNRQSIRYYVESGYVPAPFSIYDKISKLEPGHFLKIDRSGIAKQQYWSSSDIEVDYSLVSASETMLIDQLDSLINESVKLRLVSDVPLGAFLSGGIDSSLVTALMVKNSRDPVKTFTIGFQDKEFNESSFAAEVAAYLRTSHTCEHLAVDQLLELMPVFLDQYDEPFFDYSAFPVMAVSRLARTDVSVILSGDGGDEAFGGYHYYQIMQKLQQIHKIPQSIRSIGCSVSNLSQNQRLRWLGEVISSDGPASAFAFMRGVIKDATWLMEPSLLEETKPLAYLFKQYSSTFPCGLSYAEIGMRLDLGFTLPDDYLQKVDLGSMAFSLEARDPLLDHKIIEWSAKLPLNWKIRNGKNKYLLRKLAYRYIPREILDRPKMGFGVPMAKWLREGLRDWGESLLSNNEAFEALELNQQATGALWKAHQENKVQAHTALWSVLVLLQFYKNQFE